MSSTTETRNPIPTAKSYDIPALRDTLSVEGYKLFYTPETTSTMELAFAATTGKAVFLTDHQTDGRGRWGRTWFDSPGSSILMTVAEPFEDSQGDPNKDSLLPSQLFTLAACIGLQRVTGTESIQIKWPNDLVHAGKKLGGVLVEDPGDDGIHKQTKFFGIGINAHASPDLSELKTDYDTTTIDDISSRLVQRQDLVTAVVRTWYVFSTDLSLLANQKTFDYYDALWQHNAWLLGQRVRIIIDPEIQENVINGTVLRTNFGGGISIQTDQGDILIDRFYPRSRIEMVP